MPGGRAPQHLVLLRAGMETFIAWCFGIVVEDEKQHLCHLRSGSVIRG